ncbi:MAG: hypothetical protein ACI8RZ_003156 [Myxococcota bacterium]|jgi:hypothetical protein
MPPSGKRDVCYSEVIPAIFCADPDRGQALLTEINGADFRDAVLSRITQDHFPTTDVFCAQITDSQRQTLCRRVVVSARLRGLSPDSACAAVPQIDLPRTAECDCNGPDTALRMLAPVVTPPVTDLNALLGTVPGKLARCHQETLYPGCPCFIGEAVVVAEVVGGAVESVVVEGDLPEVTAACFATAVEGHAFGAHSGTIQLPVRIAP